jgi:hypothetical protein
MHYGYMGIIDLYGILSGIDGVNVVLKDSDNGDPASTADKCKYERYWNACGLSQLKKMGILIRE